MSSIILIIFITFTHWSEPVLVLELWPCEGRPHFESTGQELRLHAESDRKSNIVRTYRPRRGRRILWDKTEYQTIAPATVTVIRAVTLDGQTFGRVHRITSDHYFRGDIENRKLRFKTGEQFEYLQYRAEGACIIRVEGEVIEIERCRWIEDNNYTFEMSGEPKTEWWIRVIEANKPLIEVNHARSYYHSDRLDSHQHRFANRADFCLSCHTMEDHGKSLLIVDQLKEQKFWQGGGH